MSSCYSLKTWRVIAYGEGVGRWQPDARARLERAAISLFTEQGFAATTVPQITARAGLTTRTFFRYFADKREVFFAGDEIPALARRLIAEAPITDSPMTVVVDGLRRVAEARFEGRRAEFRLRSAIIDSDDSLRERDLRKRAVLVEAVRSGFADRGVDAVTAAVVADLAVTTLSIALEQWLATDDDRPLVEHIYAVLETVRSIQGSLSR